MNEVKLSGTISVRKTWPARKGDDGKDKKALAFGSIKADCGYVDLKAFGPAAEALGNANELAVTVTGRIATEKPKDAPKGTPWKVLIVVEKVEEQPVAEQAKAEEDMPF